MFAYCLNNPVNLDDSEGNWPQWLKDGIKWATKEIGKPIVKAIQNSLAEVDMTVSAGYNVSGTPSFWIFNGQLGISADTKGNVAIQKSFGGGLTVGNYGISGTGYASITNAPNIDKLNGPFYQVGGSSAAVVGGVPVAAGGDIVFMPDTELNKGYFGLTGNIGFGTPGVEAHVEWGNTSTFTATRFNVFDIARDIYNMIMEW